MLQALDARDSLTCYMPTVLDDVDLPALQALLHDAWLADYRDQFRIAFDEPFLRRMMRESTWVACMIFTLEGIPVGFEMALERMLYVDRHPLLAYYPILFTVSAQHRRRGLGQ